MAGPGHADRGCAAAVVSTAEGLTAAKAARRRELWCGQLCCAGGGVWPTNALAELAEEQAEGPSRLDVKPSWVRGGRNEKPNNGIFLNNQNPA